MKELIKSTATNIGIGVPFFIILYFNNPTLFSSLSNIEIVLLAISISICKELVIWGLKE